MTLPRRKLLIGGAASLGAVGCGLLPRRGSAPAHAAPAAARSSRPPNVLMIAIDDMKPWVGPYGYSAAKTPSLDALARRGLVFERAYCAAPACSPSRAAVFTGVAPHESGCYFNRHSWKDHLPGVVTLPRMLKNAGYLTAGYGKLFHVNRHDDRDAWHDRSYLKLIDMPKGAPLNVPKSIWRRSGSRFDWAALDRPVEEMDDHKQVDRAIDAMGRDHGRPWFVACGIFRPHLPWYVPRAFFDMHPLEEIELPVVPEDDLNDVPRRGRSFTKRKEHEVLVSRGLWRQAVQAYMASISYADYEVGRLLEAVPEDTVILLWSDHGWHLGPKNHWHKYTLWEEASQTVLAMAGPGVVEGQSCKRTVSLNDIYPTLSELCGVRPSHELSGKSLLPLAADPSRPWNRPALTTYGPGNHSVRTERFRYIRYDDGSRELYDHQSDPNEWTNLAGDVSRERLMRRLDRLLPPRRRGRRRRVSSWMPLSAERRALLPV